MKTKFTALLASAAFSLSMATGANAQTFGECVAVTKAQFDGTIVDAAIATPELSTLVDLVVAAGLDDALATLDDITVFAPTNDAFAALPTELVDVVVGDTDLLTAVLTYHVSPGGPDPRRLPGAVSQRKDTLQGQSVYFSRTDGMPRVNNAGVSCQGVETDNGTVWIIDSVLLPAL